MKGTGACAVLEAYSDTQNDDKMHKNTSFLQKNIRQKHFWYGVKLGQNMIKQKQSIVQHMHS